MPRLANDDRRVADEQSELSCHCAAIAPNPVAQVTEGIGRVEGTLCTESAKRAESTESAPTEVVPHRLVNELSRLTCSDVSGLSYAESPPLQQQPLGDQGVCKVGTHVMLSHGLNI